jgi:hypothetical protein
MLSEAPLRLPRPIRFVVVADADLGQRLLAASPRHPAGPEDCQADILGVILDRRKLRKSRISLLASMDRG